MSYNIFTPIHEAIRILIGFMRFWLRLVMINPKVGLPATGVVIAVAAAVILIMSMSN